ncbi:hypothetical protein M405DRAFT_857665 [Rhizopogon salebrosus TDB-379]|nr:hypothetical protein M405DRAFT_857665 [Rhizopogon salebrosus TDB-379]
MEQAVETYSESARTDAEAQVADLRSRIIAAIRACPDPDREKGCLEPDQEFSGVSEDDFDALMEAVFEDDKLLRKPSYAPHLERLTLVLPTQFHADIRTLMRSNLLRAVRLLIAIGKEFDFKIYVFEMSTRMFTDNDHGYVNFGVPDLQLELECYDLEPGFPLWCMEISFLQSSDEVVDKLKRFAAHPDIIALTLFDISEFVRYSPPKDDSVTVEMLSEKDVLLSFREWSRPQNHPLVNGVSSFGHTWIHPLSVTITSWLRPREGTFDLDDYTPGVYASAQFSPSRDSDGLESLQRIFRRTLGRIQGALLTSVKQQVAQDGLHVGSIKAVRDWTPPSELVNWDNLMKVLERSAARTGYARYRAWHTKFLERNASTPQNSPGAGSDHQGN